MSIFFSSSTVFENSLNPLASSTFRSKYKGFTFIELLIAISILFIMTTMAIPAMTSTLNNSRQNGQIATFLSYLQLTRTEAIFKNKKMLMCKSDDQQYCNNDTNWAEGWIIFSDLDNNKQKDDNEEIIFSHGKLAQVSKILYKSFSGSSNYVQFYQAGYSHTNGTFVFCNTLGLDHTKTIVISRTGRIREENSPSQTTKDKCINFI